MVIPVEDILHSMREMKKEIDRDRLRLESRPLSKMVNLNKLINQAGSTTVKVVLFSSQLTFTWP